MAVLDGNGLAFLWQQIKSKYQAKDFKTGSSTVYKELTDNNLTDALKTNYDSAYTLTSSLTASASEINQLDGITLGTASEGTISTGGISNNSTNLVTEAQVKTYVDTGLADKIDTSSIGANSGICPLNASGIIDSNYLPSYVDDVVEGYYDTSADKFYKNRSGSENAYTYTNEITGETGKIYLDVSNNTSYRYGGSTFVVLSSGGVSALTNSEIETIINSVS